MLVAQGMTQLNAQTNQFRLVFFQQFFDFDNQYIAQIDFCDDHRLAGFIKRQHVPILQKSIAGQRNRDVIALFCFTTQTVLLSIPLIQRQIIYFSCSGTILPLLVAGVTQNGIDDQHFYFNSG